MLAEISASGDIGYTYGTYKVTENSKVSLTVEGTYATVWIKKKNCKCKAILYALNLQL